MAKSGWHRAAATVGLVSAIVWAVAQAGCGADAQQAPTDSDGGDSGNSAPDGMPGDETVFVGADGGGPVTSISIIPASPIVDVTIDNGVITTAPLTLTAVSNQNAPVAANFAIDRGELGKLVASTGIFTASGNVSGTGSVTATFGNLTATTPLSVRIKITQSGKPAPDGGAPDAGGGTGGNNGVGGNDYGGPVSPQTVAILSGAAVAPANAAELGWLYPYDRTVWPRGILAPLLQWQTTHAPATKYVRIHLEQKLFSFDGYYAAPNFINHPVDQAAWRKALLGNTGDPLKAALYLSDGSTVWGPIEETWTVSPGILKGTVYYNSYNSSLVSGSKGAVLAIQPGAYAPSIALPGTEASCHVCHEVSSDGSTLITQDETYSNGASYDLTQKGAVLSTYSGAAPDNTSNNRKFLWGGLYPDGSFGLSNSRHAREHTSIDSNLFARSNGSAIASTGFTSAVKAAVTPAFSPDGRHVTFNFWEGPGAAGVTAGGGHSLAIMDFDCGQADGGKACGSPPFAFSNLRELYRDNAHFPGWPAFYPDGSGVVFHNTVQVSNVAGDAELSTWGGAQAELWSTDTGLAPAPVRMNLANGRDSNGVPYLPSNGSHPADTVVNYEPTVNPVASGGYFWVVFTSRRMYGNVAAGDGYDNGNGKYPIPKKLWVAAVDANGKPAIDASHPAFYLPGQELNAGNMRGFWVIDPCKPSGNACETGEECCGGFCRQDPDGGGLQCTDKPPMGCAQELEKCATDADCCGASQGVRCINGYCSKPGPN